MPRTRLPLMMTLLLSLAVMPLVLIAQPSKKNFQLVWSDEFETDGLPDAKNWGYEEGCSVRNSELQYYTRARIENAHIEDGMLTIEARKEKTGNCDYTSANLVSSGKRSVKYGLFELRAKIDIRAGSWPAWWWLPNSGGWPRGGEIDMMEFYKGKALFNVMDGNQKWYSKATSVDAAWADRFHVWTWVWDSLKIDLWIDNILMNHFNVAAADNTGPNGENPFRRPGYMLINQAIGGTNGGDPAGTSFPVKYIVDYIRHYMPAKDTAAPQVQSVVASSDQTITIVFSEPVEKSGAEKLANYSIGSGGVTLSAATLQSDGMAVTLKASPLTLGGRHTLTIGNINDRAAPPHTMTTFTKEFTVLPGSEKLTGKVIGGGTPYNNTAANAYDKAVDGSTSTFSDCTGDPAWAGLDLGAGKLFVVTGFGYYPRTGYTDRMIAKTFEISVDGVTWENIYTIESAPPEGMFTSAAIAATKPVRFVRYNGSGGYLNVCEVEFRGYPYDASAISVFSMSRTPRPAIIAIPRQFYRVNLYSIDGKLIESRQITAGMSPGPAPFPVRGNRFRNGTPGVVRIVRIEDSAGRQWCRSIVQH